VTALRDNWSIYNDVTRSALSIAGVQAYFKPFKERNGLRIPTSLVPLQYREVHSFVTNQAAIQNRPAIKPSRSRRLQIDVRDSKMTIGTPLWVLTKEQAELFLALIVSLIFHMDEANTHFIRTYLTRIPSTTASYLLQMDSSSRWLKRI